MLTEQQIDANKQLVITMLKSTNREGIDKLIDWMQKSDYFIAPSSSNYHCNYKGGLCEHSLNVYNVAKKLNESILPMSEKFEGKQIKEDSLVISTLLHDLCKVNFYKPKEKWFKDDQNQWQKYIGYEIDDNFPLGHGEKSIIIANTFIKLTGAELLAIRWHMGLSDKGNTMSDYNHPALMKALECDPLVILVELADYYSSFAIESKEDPKA